MANDDFERIRFRRPNDEGEIKVTSISVDEDMFLLFQMINGGSKAKARAMAREWALEAHYQRQEVGFAAMGISRYVQRKMMEMIKGYVAKGILASLKEADGRGDGEHDAPVVSVKTPAKKTPRRKNHVARDRGIEV